MEVYMYIHLFIINCPLIKESKCVLSNSCDVSIQLFLIFLVTERTKNTFQIAIQTHNLNCGWYIV